MTEDARFVQEAVDAVIEALSIDERWSVRDAGSLTWWPHTYRQRIWSDPPQYSHGTRVTRIHAETPLYCDVVLDDGGLRFIASLNGFATQSALIYEPEGGRLSLHCDAYMHAGNRWLLTTFKIAAALQIAEATVVLKVLQTGPLGGEPDIEHHPTSGPRTDADEMVGIGEYIASVGAAPSPFSAGDFRDLVRDHGGLWLVATSGETGATAEFAFLSEIPVGIGQAPATREQARALANAYAEVGRTKGEGADSIHGVVWVSAISQGQASTALLQLRSSEPHPRIGSGLIAILRLPIRTTAADAARLANDLNRWERGEWTDTHALGAWCTQGEDLGYVSFVPRIMVGSDGSRARTARLVNVATSMAVRSRWAADKLQSS